MKVTIDRFEGKFAVCEQENRQMINIPIQEIPFIVKEGDVLIIDGDNYRLDIEETKQRKKRIEDMTKDLWE